MIDNKLDIGDKVKRKNKYYQNIIGIVKELSPFKTLVLVEWQSSTGVRKNNKLKTWVRAASIKSVKN